MSAEKTSKAPKGVQVVAWLYIVSGVLSAVMVALGALSGSAMSDPGLSDLPGMDACISPHLAQMISSRTGFGWPDIYELVFAVLALWFAIGLLRLKPWARGATEWLTWATFAGTVAFGIYYIYLWRDIAAALANNVCIPADQKHMLQAVGTATGIVLTAVCCAPWIAAVRYLRGAAARAALAPNRGSPAAR